MDHQVRNDPAGSSAGRWWPGLEGLRGAALIAVFVYHQDSELIPGGFLSVSLFFTLSGFLITSLVLGEFDRSGRLDVRRFWARRVRRLLPVAMVGLAFAALVARATRPGDLLGPVATDIRYAAANLANWRFIDTDTSYAAALTTPSPVTHYWSLAIEEQYYLVYPVLAALALRAGRRGLGVLLVGLMTVSFAAQLVVGGGDRAYFGTDTRLAELAIGGLAAVLWTGRLKARLLPSIDVLAGIAGLGVAVLWWRLPLGSPRVWHGGLLVHSVLASLLVVGAVSGRVVPRITSFRPAAWVGGLSYAAYVVHFPIFLYFDHQRTGLAGVPLWLLRVGLAIGAAYGLRALVERPVRFGQVFQRWQAPIAAVTALGVVVVLATALPHVGREPSALERAYSGGVIERPVEPDPAPDATVDTPPTTAPAPTLGERPAAGPASVPPTTVAEARRPLRLLFAGDSTAGVWASGFERWAARSRSTTVHATGGPGCVLHQEGLASLRAGWLYEPTAGCTLLMDLVVQDARRVHPDAIVVQIGSIQLADWVAGDDAVPTSILDPAFAARYRLTFDRALDQLSTQLDVPILVATIPGPRWDPLNAPGSGDLTINSVARARKLNEINASVVAEHPRARMVPFAEAVDDRDGWVDLRLHADGLHVDEEKVPGVLDGGLAEPMRAAYRSVLTTEPSLRRPGSTIWWR